MKSKLELSQLTNQPEQLLPSVGKHARLHLVQSAGKCAPGFKRRKVVPGAKHNKTHEKKVVLLPVLKFIKGLGPSSLIVQVVSSPERSNKS